MCLDVRYVDARIDTAQVIMEACCGWVGALEDIDWLATKIKETAAMTVAELTTRA